MLISQTCSLLFDPTWVTTSLHKLNSCVVLLPFNGDALAWSSVGSITEGNSLLMLLCLLCMDTGTAIIACWGEIESMNYLLMPYVYGVWIQVLPSRDQ